MAAPKLVSRLEDILEAMAAIAEYTADKAFDDYARERIVRDAVERNLERISEASRHIPDHLKARHAEIPWQQVAGIGNILRHAYPIVDDSLVWEVVVRDLPPLKAAIEAMLRNAESGQAEDRVR